MGELLYDTAEREERIILVGVATSDTEDTM